MKVIKSFSRVEQMQDKALVQINCSQYRVDTVIVPEYVSRQRSPCTMSRFGAPPNIHRCPRLINVVIDGSHVAMARPRHLPVRPRPSDWQLGISFTLHYSHVSSFMEDCWSKRSKVRGKDPVIRQTKSMGFHGTRCTPAIRW